MKFSKENIFKATRRAVFATGIISILGAASAKAAESSESKGFDLNKVISPNATIDLWPNGNPSQPLNPIVEKIEQRAKPNELSDRYASAVTRPRMDVFLAKNPNGSAILVSPGGGYGRIVFDHEGYDIAKFYTERGISVFVLYYRLPQDKWGQGANVALSDAQRAMRIIKSRAFEFKIDANRIAALGFSAGGHLCADLGARFDAITYDFTDEIDKLSARPFLCAPIYPVISMDASVAHMGSRKNLIGENPSEEMIKLHSPDRNITPNTPPMFLCHAEDDGAVNVKNSLALREGLRANNIKTETHLFPEGGHGFSIRRSQGLPCGIWPELFYNYAKKAGLYS